MNAWSTFVNGLSVVILSTQYSEDVRVTSWHVSLVATQRQDGICIIWVYYSYLAQRYRSGGNPWTFQGEPFGGCPSMHCNKSSHHFCFLFPKCQNFTPSPKKHLLPNQTDRARERQKEREKGRNRERVQDHQCSCFYNSEKSASSLLVFRWHARPFLFRPPAWTNLQAPGIFDE